MVSVNTPGLTKLDVSWQNQLSCGESNIGEPTRSELTKLNQQISRSPPCWECLRFFCSVKFSSLSNKLPLLQSCLNPNRRIQAPLSAIEYFAKHIHIPKGKVLCVAD